MFNCLHRTRYRTHDVSELGQKLEHLDRTYTLCEAVWKKISGQTDGTDQPSRRFEEVKTLYLQVFCSALGRTRTCGLLIRSQIPGVIGMRQTRIRKRISAHGISPDAMLCRPYCCRAVATRHWKRKGGDW